jgi:glycosyltransferase involved in cell wall biosynthesis
MIVRNEEKNLPGCLESVKGLFPEVVIANTGSTDATKEVAQRFGAGGGLSLVGQLRRSPQ